MKNAKETLERSLWRFCMARRGIARSAFLILLQLREFCLHGGIAARQPLDGQILRLVVGQAQIVFRFGQIVLDLLQMLDGLIDLGNGIAEAIAGQAVVVGESISH